MRLDRPHHEANLKRSVEAEKQTFSPGTRVAIECFREGSIDVVDIATGTEFWVFPYELDDIERVVPDAED